MSAAFAAIAAGASWASVWQTRKVQRAAATPDLNVRMMVDPHAARLVVFVDNVGGVAASGVNYMATYNGSVDYGQIGNGFASPGQTVGPVPTGLVATGSVAGNAMRVVVTCRDRFGVLHSFSHLFAHKQYKPGLFKGEKTPSKQVLMADLFPGHVLEGHTDVNTGKPIAGQGLL